MRDAVSGLVVVAADADDDDDNSDSNGAYDARSGVVFGGVVDE